MYCLNDNKYKHYTYLVMTAYNIKSKHQSSSKKMKPAESSVLVFIQFSNTRAAASLFICQNVLSEWASQKKPHRWRHHPPGHVSLFLFSLPFGTLNSWIIRSRIWVSSIYVNLKIGVSNVKHGLFEICRFVFIHFFTVVVLTKQMHQLPAAKTDTDNQHPGIQH